MEAETFKSDIVSMNIK